MRILLFAILVSAPVLGLNLTIESVIGNDYINESGAVKIIIHDSADRNPFIYASVVLNNKIAKSRPNEVSAFGAINKTIVINNIKKGIVLSVEIFDRDMKRVGLFKAGIHSRVGNIVNDIVINEINIGYIPQTEHSPAITDVIIERK